MQIFFNPLIYVIKKVCNSSFIIYLLGRKQFLLPC